MATTITVVNDITLVTLQSAPTNVSFISDVLEKIAEREINIDMISMAPAHSNLTSLSFTICDSDLVSMLNMAAEIKKAADVKAVISSLNNKISVSDPDMKNTPGMAARVFKTISSSEADIRLITTSEIEISILVSDAYFDTVLTSLEKEFAE